MKTLTENEFMMEKKAVDAIADQTIKKLLEQPKETVYIPSQYEQDQLWEGNINGVRIHVRKNVYVDVPKAVAEVIKNNTRVLEASKKAQKKYNEKEGAKVG